MFEGHKFACVLAARADSRRLKNKNTRMCAGKPLWQWTKEAVEAAGIFDFQTVSTDSVAIIREFSCQDIPSWGTSNRPKHLTGDDVHISDVMQYYVKNWCKADSIDYLCLVSPTNPLRTGAHIREAAKLMLKEKADAVVGVAPCHSSCQTGDIGKGYHTWMPISPLLCDSQTQSLTRTYRLTGSIVIAKTELWSRKASIYNDPNIKTVGYVMPKWDIDIDTKEDLFVAEAMIEWQRKRRTSLRSSIKSAIRERFHRKSNR